LTNFPFEDTCLSLTHASYAKQPIPELANNDCGNWTLTLRVPIPEDIVHPTLTSFSYTINYSTANHQGASIVQSHILLGMPESGAIAAGISTVLQNGKYLDGAAITPQTFDGTAIIRLSSVQGIKNHDAQGQWSHFTDRQQIPINIRIVQSSCLYLQLQVSEYPTATMLRALSVDVSATWLEDQEGRRLVTKLQEAEMRAVTAEAKAAAEEAARIAAEARQAADEQVKAKAEECQRAAEAQSTADANARQVAEEEASKARSERQSAEANVVAQKIARGIAEANAEKARLSREHADHDYEVEHEERIAAEKLAETEKHALEEAERHFQEAQAAAKAAAEKRAREEAERLRLEAERVAKAEADRKAAEEKRAKDEAERLRQEAQNARKIADNKEQERIKKALDNLPANRRCPNGYAWVQESAGYRCSGGGHHITWEELNAKHVETVVVVDAKVQDDIKIVRASLPAEQQCSNGSVSSIQESAGYRSSCGSRSITSEEVNVKQAGTIAAVVAGQTVQESADYRSSYGSRSITSEEVNVKQAETITTVAADQTVQGSADYRSSCGSRSITSEEVDVKQAGTITTVVAGQTVQESADYRSSYGSRSITSEEVNVKQAGTITTVVADQTVQGSADYRSSYGSRSITSEEVNVKQAGTITTVVADQTVQESADYRSSCGSRSITSEEVDVKQAGTITTVVADQTVQESADYRSSYGSRSITSEEVNVKQAGTTAAVVAGQTVQESAGYRSSCGSRSITSEEVNVKQQGTITAVAVDKTVQESAGYRSSYGSHSDEVNVKQQGTIAAVVADQTVQETIKIALASLPAERKCPNGYAWVRESAGYRCSGGGHHITWEELNTKCEETVAVVVVDEKVREKIKITLASLPAERRCPNGYASWVQESTGYRCSCGTHYVTLEELDVKQKGTIATVVADETVQEEIKIALANLPAERKCPNGYAWVQESTGYRCSGGGHHITWEELNAKHGETKVVVAVDEKVQEKIKIVLASLPAERQCSNGAAWVQDSTGYRCSCGVHYVTFEELNAKYESTVAVVVADAKVQENIKTALACLPAERQCPNGYAWIQESAGYRCSGGGHHITWEELDAKHEVPKTAVVADEETQGKIKKALDNLPAERKCPKGYGWVQEDGGYRCTGGGHHITWEELHADHPISAKVTHHVANNKEQEMIRKALHNLPHGRRCPNGYGWLKEAGGFRCKGGNHHINWQELHAV